MGFGSRIGKTKPDEHDDEYEYEEISDESDIFVTAPNTPRAPFIDRAPPSPCPIASSGKPVKQVALVARGTPC
jgi:hypothetical protein